MIVFHKLRPHGFQFGIFSKTLERAHFAITVGKIHEVEYLSNYAFGVGFWLKGLQKYQFFWRW